MQFNSVGLSFDLLTAVDNCYSFVELEPGMVRVDRTKLAIDAPVIPIAVSPSSDGVALVANAFEYVRKDFQMPEYLYRFQTDQNQVFKLIENHIYNHAADWTTEFLNTWYDFYVTTRIQMYAYVPIKHKRLETHDLIITGFICRLVDLVDGKRTEYVKSKKVWSITAVESSKKNKSWEVIIYDDGTLSCNCPAWKYRGGVNNPHDGCKHVVKIMESDLYVKWQDTHKDIPF